MKAWQAQIAMGILETQTGFKRGDHIIFRGFSGEDIYGKIVGVCSKTGKHFRVKADNGSSWSVRPKSMVFAD